MASDMAGRTGTEVADFASFLERYRTDVALRQLHLVRVAMGVFWALAVVAYNHFRIAAPGAEAVVTRVATMVCAAHVLACLVTFIIARRRLLADLRREAPTLRERAWQVANFVQRRGNTLLMLAFTGQVLVLLGTEFKLRLFGADGEVLLVALIPTLLLMAHGIGEIPTRERLCRLYGRLVRLAPPTVPT
jgi:hypothetical protein